jgi:hypothetical protein
MLHFAAIWCGAVEQVVNRIGKMRPKPLGNTDRRASLPGRSTFAKAALALFCQIRQNCLTLTGSLGRKSAPLRAPPVTFGALAWSQRLTHIHS